MPRRGSTTSPRSKRAKTVPLPPKFRRFVEETKDIEKSWMGDYDGILESWYEDCLKFVESKVGKVPLHVVGFLGSDVFKMKYPTASDSRPVTYAFRTQRGQSISDISINLDELMKMPPQDIVLKFFLGLIEEILHTRYGLTKNEVEIGEMTNALTEQYLGIWIDARYKRQSSKRRQLIDKGSSPTV